MNLDQIRDYLPPVWGWWIVAGVCAAILTWMVTRTALRAARAAWRARKTRTRTPTSPAAVEDWLTRIVAGIATGVSAQGMWQFAGDKLELDGPLRLILFAFIEFAIVVSAVRAKRSMRENYSAGLDGIAVWALACLTAVLSCLDAKNFAEGVFRLAAPLVAAWMWERGMRLERHRMRGTKGINWRLTPERILVWLGLAEARDRTASEVDTHRRLKRVALAAKKVHQLREAGAKQKKVQAALAKRDHALDLAVEHTDLATNPRTQTVLLDLVTTLGGADSLSQVLGEAKAPWAMLDHPAVTGAARHSEAAVLAAETRRLTEAVLSERDPDAAATIKMLAAMLTDRRIPPPGTATRDQVSPTVSDLVSSRVSLRAVPPPPDDTASDTGSDTTSDTWKSVSAEVSDEVSDAVRDAFIATLREEEDDTGDDTETATSSATDAMRRYWDEAIDEGRVPTGVELAQAGGCGKSYGRRKRREWIAELDGRTVRRLLPKKVTA